MGHMGAVMGEYCRIELKDVSAKAKAVTKTVTFISQRPQYLSRKQGEQNAGLKGNKRMIASETIKSKGSGN